MRVCIHRGSREIGGTCIELWAEGQRLLLDLGLPLDRDPMDEEVHPRIDGLGQQSNLLGLVLSHGHLDHVGLAHLAAPDLPVALGAATYRIMQAAAPFVPKAWVPRNVVEIADGIPVQFGPFAVTPHLVDHSAYDAYALEIEAGGRRLFYSGDFRAHGRKSMLFERMLANPPRDIDVMLMEGSSFGRISSGDRFPTETEVEDSLLDIFRRTAGMVLVAASAQNIDRMVSLYRACKRAGRMLFVDLYAAEILRATVNPRVPQAQWSDIFVYMPHYQRVRIKQSGRFDLIEPYRERRVYSEKLRSMAPKAVMLFRSPMLPDLRRAECLEGAAAVWSQWEGYLKRKPGRTLAEDLARDGLLLHRTHTSGHASVADLQRLAAAVAPKVLVPIHTFEPGAFPVRFENVSLKEDGCWWEIAA